jgi:hypothetical protein
MPILYGQVIAAQRTPLLARSLGWHPVAMVRSAAPMGGPRTRAARRTWEASSTAVLLVAVALIAAAAALVLLHHRILGGVVALAAGAILLWGWYLAERMVAASSTFVGMLVDPLYDAALLGSVAWVSRKPEPSVSVLALVALGLCYLASYERARADALGYRTFEGVGYRAARCALISASALIAAPTVPLWLLIVLATGAVAVRGSNVAIQHRRERRGRSTTRPAGPAAPERR